MARRTAVVGIAILLVCAQRTVAAAEPAPTGAEPTAESQKPAAAEHELAPTTAAPSAAETESAAREPAPASEPAPTSEPAPAPAKPVPAGTKSALADGKAGADGKSRAPSFAIVPGPFYNPNIGLGVNVIPMLMFHPSQKDAVSPPSMAMLNALWAIKPPFDEGAGSRQSAFVSAATRLYLDEDRWRVVGMVAYLNLFQEFYGIGGDVSYSNPAFNYRLEQLIAIGQVYRQIIWKGFYVGALLGYVTFHTKTADPANEAILESLGSGSSWRGQPNVGFLSQYDTRNNKYYPAKGVNFNLRMNGSFKEDESYLLIAPNFNQYFPLLGEDRVILAYRLFGQFGFGNLPMSAYAHYGMRGTTLGYESGEYMDKMMTGAEAEVRWIVWKRIGVEGGGGVGKVFASFSEFPGQPWLPGVWGSGTYKIMEKQDLRARATVAYGKSGVLFYFTVGQNF
jgi:hypothetical protein